MEMFCTNQIEGELGKDVLGKARQGLAFIWTLVAAARGHFKGTPSNSSCLVQISTNLRREAAQIYCQNKVT